MKKVLLVLSMVLLGVGLSACGQKSGENAASSEQSIEAPATEETAAAAPAEEAPAAEEAAAPAEEAAAPAAEEAPAAE